MNYIKNYIFLIFAGIITLTACSEKSTNTSIDDNSKTNIFDKIEGNWSITQSCATNGPICYEHPLYNVVKFEKSKDIENGLFYIWNLDGKDYNNLFEFTFNDTLIQGVGNYQTTYTDENNNTIDTCFKQFIEIILQGNNRINCKLKLEVYDPDKNETMLGEVTNFFAEKIK